MPPETSVVARVWKGRFSPTVMRASSLSVVRICGVDRMRKSSSVLTALMMAVMLETVTPPIVNGSVSMPRASPVGFTRPATADAAVEVPLKPPP